VLLQGAAPETVARAAAWGEAVARMGRASSVAPLEGAMPEGSAQVVVDEATVVLPLAGIIDLAAERARLEKDRAKAEAEAEKVRRKLDNADFVARAKPEVVEENRERLAAFEAEVARITAAIGRIS
jgi:valyl-tRNA synthetase